MLSIDCAYVQNDPYQVQNSALMAEGNPKSPKSPTKELSHSDTSEEEQVNPILRTSEERHYRTTCASALATQIPLSHSRVKQIQLLKEDLVVK